MKKYTTMMSVLMIVLSAFNLFGQWKYKGAIKFPTADSSIVQPFLATVDDSGKLYVISSRATNLNAHDAIYYLKNSQDSVLTKMIDFTANGDTTNVKMLVGITHIKNDILVSAKINNYVAPGGQSCSYYYVGGDTMQSTRYGYQPYLSGWGTTIYGITATRDSIVFAGANYTQGIRAFNFTSLTPFAAHAAYISPDNSNMEPGGVSTAGFDVIRDCAVIPNGDYFDTHTPLYTSRNSKQTGELNGGIAAWTGGTQYNQATLTSNHQNYSAIRVSDPDDFLKFNSSIPYGITCDGRGYLWAAGIDSTRRWVKGFKVDLITGIATQMDELPSSKKLIDPDPAGAPMTGPSDVAFNANGTVGYVCDAWQRVVYRFERPDGVNDVAEKPVDFSLHQNYPNPFNPSTVISYTVPAAMEVKLTVTNLLGQEVAVLVNNVESAGTHSVRFDAKHLANGIYYYTLRCGNAVATKKMLLLK